MTMPQDGRSGTDPARPVIVGEVLFDAFPDGRKVLGGAPFNVAWHLSAFGHDPLFVSAVGDDEDGHQIREAMQSWGLDTRGLTTSARYPTGRVVVTHGHDGPEYEIDDVSAWDDLELTGAVRRSIMDGGYRLLVHGSLVLRAGPARGVIEELRNLLPEVVVDINLRQEWWTPDRVRDAIAGCSLLKVNEEELRTVSTLLAPDVPDDAAYNTADNVPDSVPDHVPDNASVVERATLVRDRLDGADVVVTSGQGGALSISDDGVKQIPASEPSRPIVDTVGAGDAFTSVLIAGRLRGWSLAETLPRAAKFAAEICTRQGATSTERSPYESLQEEWGRQDASG